MTTKVKTVDITGSTDGVGRYVAERLAAQGWRVLVHGRDRARGEAVVERIHSKGATRAFLSLISPRLPRFAGSRRRGAARRRRS